MWDLSLKFKDNIEKNSEIIYFCLLLDLVKN